MLTAALEDRFRRRLGNTAGREGSIRFAVDFAQLVVRILPDEVDNASVHAVAKAIQARTDLSDAEVATLLDLALAPEHRGEITEPEIAAFGSRFGIGAAEALRAAVADEVDLEAFAARYGPAEALLLLDGLFGVCAVDDEIDPQEIDRLQVAARRLQVDPMLVGLLYRKHDAKHAEGDTAYDLRGKRTVLVGRDGACDVPLPDPQVAPRHCQLQRTTDGWRIRDLGSGRPTLVRGVPVISSVLAPGDEIRVGPYRLELHPDGETLTAVGSAAASALAIRGLRRTLPSRQGSIILLDDLRFTVFTGEVVALVGPSGAGKTTLLQAIAGIAPPDEGEIRFENADFHHLLASDRSLVGIVPQEDIVHGELTVSEALWYAGRLRFPSTVDGHGVKEAVDRVLGELDIAHIRDHRIGNELKRGISGGQRKRVNLGQELLTRTTRVLFLDEPTSGLDPQTAQDIVRLTRQLADDGRIVFLVTHDVSPSILALVDHLLVLAPGGRLAWFGPPAESLAHFDVHSVDEIFARLPDKEPSAWRDAYAASQAHRKYVTSREHLLGLDALPTAERTPGRSGSGRLAQLVTLTRRYALVKSRDTVGTGVLLAQAPLLALAFAVVFPFPDGGTLFVAVLSALWFGASAAVRELISDRAIWRREARVGVGVIPWVASKVAVLAVLVSIQCLLLVGVLHTALGMGAYGFSLPALAAVATAVGLTGLGIGLLLSATFASSEAAVGSLPLVLIPQIAFGGLLVKVKEMGTLAKALTWLMVTRFGFEAALKTGDKVAMQSSKGIGGSEMQMRGYLWELGFRTTTNMDDMGLTWPELLGALGLFGGACLVGATILTARARDGA
ncbi:MAG: ATP-binding cassette domain-containing protein [Alphaproteobacteria bacterium]|nr:ATP-binding cassette domain-containing protein [Alphaproteobacteria bacterium]